MELNDGKLAEDDYLAKSYKYLGDVVATPPPRGQYTRDDALLAHRVNDALSPTYSGLEHGLMRLSNGTWYLAGTTELGSVTGEMFEWWFNHCDCSERFQWSHPIHNLEGEYDPTFYATQPEDRLPGHYIGHSFIYKQRIGETNYRMHVDYLNPSEYCDTSLFVTANVTACITGQLYQYHKDFGEIYIGEIVYIVKENGIRNQLVTRMWLGDVRKVSSGFPPSSFVNYVANSYLYRLLAMPYSYAFDMWKHILEENGCIAHLLPHFYRAENARLRGKSGGKDFSEVEQEFEEYSDPEESPRSKEGNAWEEVSMASSVSPRTAPATTFEEESEPDVPGPLLAPAPRSGKAPMLKTKQPSFETVDSALDPISIDMSAVSGERNAKHSKRESESSASDEDSEDNASDASGESAGRFQHSSSSGKPSSASKLGGGVGV
eukprot:CAMPEP_0185040334 /NCGR_PEP_ID=MMETSP1103-20130426/38274_1 /TAXON_ID=36769 /ORGANISM="Paraphysomonas bandaiensis, Strain Caron Lab Isolate" /LENGTH=432 /DNA_ID=CAMNT_0027579591 /DNA_START=224 /DNA_END=1522 /DNA_ORIENTATION=-